jgi:glycosyltransferase involved in cell wall biosynthesis
MDKITKSVPKVAVITRTKNRNIFLERAIKSAQNQSMKDFVQIVVNDGGDKNSVEQVVKKHQKLSQGRIKIVHNPASIGHTKALNQGIRDADSKYIAILDDDDTWAPDYLKKTVEHLDKTGAKGVVAVIDKVVEETLGDRIKVKSTERWRPDIKAVSLYGQCIDNYAPTVAFVYQKSVYEELGGYDESLEVAEDWDFTIRFLLNYDIDFLNTQEALAYYHHRPDAKGFNGNSVFARREQQSRNLNLLRNRYLREDIKKGRLGLGFIMNQLNYQKHTVLPAEIEREKQQTTRLEAHINHVAGLLRKQLNHELIGQMSSMIRDNRFENRVLNRAKRATKRIFKP